MTFLLKLHGEFRWLVLLVGAALAIRCVVGWSGRKTFGKVDRGLTAAFAGLMDLNAVLGLILLFGLPGGILHYRLEHGVTMILAAVTAHLSALWRRGDDAARFRNGLFVTVAALALVLVGVLRLRGGWMF